MNSQQTDQLPNILPAGKLYQAFKNNPAFLQPLYDIMGKEIFRPYYFPDTGIKSGEGLTPVGLTEYLMYLYEKKPALFSSTIACINWDVHCTPQFDAPFLKNLRAAIAENEGRTTYIIYRRNHTVSLMKEDNNFLLLDSYNAYGAKDADNLPLLSFLRKNFPFAQIHTLHDKIQNDYHNCAFFATHSAAAIENDLLNKNQTLFQFVNGLDTNKVHIPNMNNPQDRQKIEEYYNLNIETLPIPPQIVPFVQSLSLSKKITEGSQTFHEEQPWITHGSYARQLDFFSREEQVGESQKLRHINTQIATKNETFRFNYEAGYAPTSRAEDSAQ